MSMLSRIARELINKSKDCLKTKDCDGNTALNIAALHGHTTIVEILIENGANLEDSNMCGKTALHCAASKGMTKTAECLLNAVAVIDSRDIVSKTPLLLAAERGHTKTVELLIERRAEVTYRDPNGNNCLDHAIDSNHSSTSMVILESVWWLYLMRNSTEDFYSGERDTPMRKLIRKMPDVAAFVLNRCAECCTEDVQRESFEVCHMYELLDDGYLISQWKDGINDEPPSGDIPANYTLYTNDAKTYKKNHPVMIMVSHKREKLLNHPLVLGLLHSKWRNSGRYFYYVNYVMYVIFLFFITGYVVSSDPPYIQDKIIQNSTTNQSMSSCELLDVNGYKQARFSSVGKYFIITLVILNILKEGFQLYQSKIYYLTLGNLIEVVMYVCSFVLVTDFHDCQKGTGYRYVWQWNAGTVAILLAWVNLVLFTEKFPMIGIYVLIMKDILWTFMNFFTVFALLIIGFALAFFSLLQNQSTFSTVWQSLIKTTVMMTGEFDYDGIYTDGEVSFKVISYMLFYVFVIMMSIIVMNLLIGLAVDNIKEIQDKAFLTRKGMQVGLALDVEVLAPDFVRRRLVRFHETIKPNAGRKAAIRRNLGLEKPKLTKAYIRIVSESGDKGPNDFEEMRTEITALHNTIKNLKNKIEEVKESLQNKKNEKVD